MRNRFEYFTTSDKLATFLDKAIEGIEIVFRNGDKRVVILNNSTAGIENFWVAHGEINRKPVSIFDCGLVTKYVSNVRTLEAEILRFLKN